MMFKKLSFKFVDGPNFLKEKKKIPWHLNVF